MAPGTEGANSSPTFSPDSRSIAFRQGRGDGELLRVEVLGGARTTLARLGATPGSFLHWGTDAQIIYSGGPQGLFRVAAAGGTPEFLAKTAGAARYSFLLPDGSGVLFSRGGVVSVLTFATDSAVVLVPNAVHPVYLETGHLLYIAETGGLFAVPFDVQSHRLTGPAVAVPNRLAIVDFTGKTTALELPKGRRGLPRFAPDGRTVAYELWANRGVDNDIHTLDLLAGTDTRITFDSDNRSPLWSPDGKRVLFSRRAQGAGAGLLTKPADNSGPEQSVLSHPRIQNASAWLNDGTILFTAGGALVPRREVRVLLEDRVPGGRFALSRPH